MSEPSRQQWGLIEAAMCMWEWVCDNAKTHKLLSEWLEDSGWAHVRWTIGQWAETLDADYQTVAETWTWPFDWEFVPWWMNNRVDWETLTLRDVPIPEDKPNV